MARHANGRRRAGQTVPLQRQRRRRIDVGRRVAALILGDGIGADWATRLAGLGFSAVMVGAIVTVHARQGK